VNAVVWGTESRIAIMLTTLRITARSARLSASSTCSTRLAATRVRAFASAPPISDVTGTPIVPTNHPEHKRVMPLLLRASSTNELLSIFDKEHESYGWATAKDTITRIAKASKKSPQGTSALLKDTRFLALLTVPATALEQGVMSSKARLNYQTDDLTSIQAALKTMRVTSDVHPLPDLLARKIEEELEEEDEPGEFGSDFQGGSVGF
jgi:hypothetical protein